MQKNVKVYRIIILKAERIFRLLGASEAVLPGEHIRICRVVSSMDDYYFPSANHDYFRPKTSINKSIEQRILRAAGGVQVVVGKRRPQILLVQGIAAPTPPGQALRAFDGMIRSPHPCDMLEGDKS